MGGNVRNKGDCVGSWELPFPGNSGSQTKPEEVAASPPAKQRDTNKPPSKQHACGVQKPQTAATGRPARGMRILGMPRVPTQPLYIACWPRVCQGPCMRSADSTVASCHWSCISSISGEAPFFSVILTSVGPASSIVLPASGWPEYKIFQAQNM